MTGWRLGYLCAPAPLIKEMLKIHQYAIMCAPTASQFAAVEAMRNGDEDVEFMRDEYNRRRTYLLKGLRDIGIECFEPEGAFYLYPNIGTFGLSSEEFAEKLDAISSSHGEVAIIIGSSFGLSNDVKSACDMRLSVSKMTLTHQMLRVWLVEIIYRCLSINHGGKYHK